jgi:hypothetical protein
MAVSIVNAFCFIPHVDCLLALLLLLFYLQLRAQVTPFFYADRHSQVTHLMLHVVSIMMVERKVSIFQFYCHLCNWCA